jgi:adenine phosphoribosyltransferase
MQLIDRIKSTIRDIKDYPKPGIIFKDITPVLSDPALMRDITDEFVRSVSGIHLDAVVAIEARGFIWGALLAHELNCRFIPVRKAGKLPYATRAKQYDLEYGTATVEIHSDALQPGWRVLIHDDVLATGGTAGAAGELVQNFGAEIAGFSFLMNLGFLPGESNLYRRFGVKPHYLVSY